MHLRAKTAFYVLLAAGLAVPGAAFAQATRTLSRHADPSVLQGELLQKLWDRKTASIRVMARRDGVLQSIPFQIDKLDPDGNYMIPTGSMSQQVIDETGWDTRTEEQRARDREKEFRREEKRLEENVSSGKLSRAAFEARKRAATWKEKLDEFDFNDELVFMARDAGDRAGPDELPQNAEIVEVTIRNPVDKTAGWIYVASYPSSPPPLSPADYITYDPKSDTVESKFAVLDFVDDKPLVLEKIIGKDQKTGKSQPNVLDRFKLRITIRPIMFFTLNFDENNVKSFTAGYIDGPVRVIRRNIFWIVIGGIKLPFFPKAIVYFKFYDNQLQGPTEIFNPFNPKYMLREGSMFSGGVDLRTSVYGAQVFTTGQAKPFVIDGKMTPEEVNLASEKEGRPWFAVYKPDEEAAIIARLIFDEELQKKNVKMMFRFEDDAEREDPPENEKGYHYVGYDVDLLTFPKGKFNITFFQYLAFPFKPGDEKHYLDILDNPLQYTAR